MPLGTESAMGLGGAAIGMGLGAIGSWLGGNAANAARKRMEAAADLPGLDINSITTDSLNSLYSQIPNARRSTDAINAANMAAMDKLWSTVPGAEPIRQKQASNIQDWLSGNLSKEITDMVQRNAAVRAIGGGYGGSGMMRNLMARDLGLTGLQLQQSAMPMANEFARTQMATRFPELASIQQYTVSPNTWLGIREKERAAKQALLAQLAGMPGKTGVWSNYFTQQGQNFANAGAGMLGSQVGAGTFGG